MKEKLFWYSTLLLIKAYYMNFIDPKSQLILRKPTAKEPPKSRGTGFFQPIVHKFNYSWDDDNSFFDRIVLLRMDNRSGNNTVHKIVAPGIFIGVNHILTSYNPFKKILKEVYCWDMVAAVLRNRRKENNEYKHVTHLRFTCARQIIPLNDSEITKDQWHGTRKIHNALHDLMVIQIAGTMLFHNVPNQELPNMRHFYAEVQGYKTHEYFDPNSRSHYKTRDGPYVVDVAKPGDKLGNDVKFASVGFLDYEHINNSMELRSRNYDFDENVVEDCDEWLLPDWGHFICIRNIDNYPGIGSGAMLFHNNVLYGVGSFLMEKNKASVLVFTDVRPYHHLIFKTCTNSDNWYRYYRPFDTHLGSYLVPFMNIIEGRDARVEVKYLWIDVEYYVFSL